MVLHQVVRELGLALDAALRGKAAVGLYDLLPRHTGAPLEAVDVLRKEHLEQALLGQERNKGMRDGGVELARVELLRQDVEWLRVLAEVGDVEDGFGVGQVEAREVVVQPCFGGSKVGDCDTAPRLA
jgi:hypothetical protein